MYGSRKHFMHQHAPAGIGSTAQIQYDPDII